MYCSVSRGTPRIIFQDFVRPPVTHSFVTCKIPKDFPCLFRGPFYHPPFLVLLANEELSFPFAFSILLLYFHYSSDRSILKSIRTFYVKYSCSLRRGEKCNSSTRHLQKFKRNFIIKCTHGAWNFL